MLQEKDLKYGLRGEDKYLMKGKGLPTIILAGLLFVFVLGGWLANDEAVGVRGRKETETESTQSYMTSDGIVYGEVSAVGEETLTIRLGTLETEDGLKLTGGEVAIRTKAGTVIARMRRESTGSVEEDAEVSDEEVGFAMGNLAEGDIVSIALDEEGYAETITLLMNFSSVGMDR
ncbi:MAG: hypothetical protein LUG61_05160 [Lachnospiraceae bacterium]|nr:hypothetical protein [Lachnospiraceae bacterium]